MLYISFIFRFIKIMGIIFKISIYKSLFGLYLALFIVLFNVGGNKLSLHVYLPKFKYLLKHLIAENI